MQVINVIRNLAPTVYFHCVMAMPSSTDSLNNTKVQRILNRNIQRTTARYLITRATKAQSQFPPLALPVGRTPPLCAWPHRVLCSVSFGDRNGVVKENSQKALQTETV